MDQDGCIRRPATKTAGATVYLMEELGDARMRCDQLVRYVDEATKLIEATPKEQREGLFEAAGHLVESIPGTLFKLQKALQAVALAATRIDYEELKDELRPEKVEQLEKVLQDVRVRHVQHRSQPWTPKEAAAMKSFAEQVSLLGQELAKMERKAMSNDPWKVSAHDWTSHFSAQIMQLASPDEVREKFKKENPALDDAALDEIVGQWLKNKDVVKDKTAAKRPTFDEAKKALLKHLDGEGWKLSQPSLKVPHATNRNGSVRLWFKTQAVYMSKASPGMSHDLGDARSIHVDIRDLTPEQFMSKVEQWSKDASVNTSAWKATAAATSKDEWESALKKDEALLSKMKQDLKTLKGGGKVENLSVEGAKSTISGLEQAIANKKKFLSKLASEDDKQSKFEEGKPADPTENMSPEDAAKWKTEHAENKDNFKAAAKLDPAVASELGGAALALRNAAKGQQTKKNAIIAVRLLGTALSKMGEDRAFEVLWRAADVMQTSGMWEMDPKTASDDEDKQSKFEEGKPADPTKQMSPEDAEEWEANTEEHKDRFKAAGEDYKGKLYVVSVSKDGKKQKEGPLEARAAKALLTSKLGDPEVKHVSFERADKTASVDPWKVTSGQ